MGLEQARIVTADFDALLRTVNAQFAYVLDVRELEGRHWNNDGVMEDVATGSAAGTVGAYLTRHERIPAGDEFILRQAAREPIVQGEWLRPWPAHYRRWSRRRDEVRARRVAA
jgi:predicted PhzF superfamily epimerase YddE/YHI9